MYYLCYGGVNVLIYLLLLYHLFFCKLSNQRETQRKNKNLILVSKFNDLKDNSETYLILFSRTKIKAIVQVIHLISYRSCFIEWLKLKLPVLWLLCSDFFASFQNWKVQLTFIYQFNQTVMLKINETIDEPRLFFKYL